MSYRNSYDVRHKSYRPDPYRGKWSKPVDFIYACLTFALQMDIVLITWYYLTQSFVVSILFYIICLPLYVVPMILLQSYLGQFSTSGFITAFRRISPLFKCIGYLNLCCNLVFLVYYSLFALMPLLFFLNSMRATLPWSCEAFRNWPLPLNGSTQLDICHLRSNSPELKANASQSVMRELPSVLYFRSFFGTGEPVSIFNENVTVSWSFVGFMALIWCIVAIAALVLITNQKNLKFQFGPLVRWGIWLVMAMLLICCARLCFLPGAFRGLTFDMSLDASSLSALPHMLLLAFATFGGGSGTITAIASVNHFKTNIRKYSWIIGGAQLLMHITIGLNHFLIQQHIAEITMQDRASVAQSQWRVSLSAASVLASLEMPHLWSLLYFGMQSLAAFIVMMTRIYAVLLSLFDEFEPLRPHYGPTILSLCTLLGLTSLTFYVIWPFENLSLVLFQEIYTELFICLVLVFVVYWVYGLRRWQRDLQFMLSAELAKWKFQLSRCTIPLCLIATIVVLGIWIMQTLRHLEIILFGLLLIALPLLSMLSVIIWRVMRSTGRLKIRLSKCCKSTEWHPVNEADQRRYESAINAPEMQQLNVMTLPTRT